MRRFTRLTNDGGRAWRSHLDREEIAELLDQACTVGTMLGLRVSLLLAIATLSACAVAQPIPPQPVPLAPDLMDWAERGKEMVWSHTPTDEPVPDMPLRRFEMCGGFGIAFFDSSEHRLFIPDGDNGFLDDDLLWVAGDLTVGPERADGGFAPSPQDPTVNPYRTTHGPCEVVFEG